MDDNEDDKKRVLTPPADWSEGLKPKSSDDYEEDIDEGTDWLEEDDFRNNGGVMNHETGESISKRRKPFTVDYTGFGWLLIKNGVFEHDEMKYPWFAPKMQVFESGDVQDMCGEDVSFCLDAKAAGFEIWCDPRIRVGHEKTRVI